MQKLKIGTEVVRSKGDYVVGRIGTILEEVAPGRYQIDWGHDGKSKVSGGSIEPTSIPYEIIPGYDRKNKNGNWVHPKYKKL
jgi:hypothetical protein